MQCPALSSKASCVCPPACGTGSSSCWEGAYSKHSSVSPGNLYPTARLLAPHMLLICVTGTSSSHPSLLLPLTEVALPAVHTPWCECSTHGVPGHHTAALFLLSVLEQLLQAEPRTHACTRVPAHPCSITRGSTSCQSQVLACPWRRCSLRCSTLPSKKIVPPLQTQQACLS